MQYDVDCRFASFCNARQLMNHPTETVAACMFLETARLQQHIFRASGNDTSIVDYKSEVNFLVALAGQPFKLNYIKGMLERLLRD